MENEVIRGQNGTTRCIQRLKCSKESASYVFRDGNKVRLRYLEVYKQQARYDWCTYMLKPNTQEHDWYIYRLSATVKIQIMYFEVKIKQGRWEWGIKRLTNNKEATNDVFIG